MIFGFKCNNLGKRALADIKTYFNRHLQPLNTEPWSISNPLSFCWGLEFCILPQVGGEPPDLAADPFLGPVVLCFSLFPPFGSSRRTLLKTFHYSRLQFYTFKKEKKGG
jgi:hypothetical protein